MTLNGELPRWFGNQFHNELIEMPENEQKRIINILIDRTKRTSLKECQVPGGCEGKIVEGHDIQDAVMRRLTKGSDVMAFANRPLNATNMKNPSKAPISHAMTGFFTCKKHEQLFFAIEQSAPDFNNGRHLLLFAYKAIIKQMWDTKNLRNAFEKQAEADPKSDFPDYMIWRHMQMEAGIKYCKDIAEEMLGIAEQPPIYDREPETIKHFVITVPTVRPAVAASCWTNGLRFKMHPPDRLDRTFIEKIGQWGCTVYPTAKEHIVIFHYPSADERIVRRGTWQLRQAPDTVTLQRRLTRDLLGSMEGIVLSPEVWKSFTEGKKAAITDYFRSTLPDMDITVPDAPPIPPVDGWHAKHLRLVNIFGD